MTDYRYRVRCLTEVAWVYTVTNAVPIVCPNNALHTIDPSLTIIDDPDYASKNLSSDSFVIYNPTDSTKCFHIDVQGLPGACTTLVANPSTDITVNLPTISTTIVGTTTTDTLTNKTLTSPQIATIINAPGTLTLPIITDTLVGRTTVDTLTNKTLTSPQISTIVNAPGTLTLPIITDTLVGRTTTDTLTNKTVLDNSFAIADSVDNTVRLGFSLSGTTGKLMTLSAGITDNRTIVLQDVSTTLVGRDTTDTLTNKTLTLPTIAQIVNVGTLTLPTSADTLVGRATVDTLTNKSLVDSSIAIVDVSDNTKQLRFNVTGTTGTSTTLLTSQTTDIVLTFPTITDTIVGTTSVQTLTNKTFISPFMTTIATTGGTLVLPPGPDTLLSATSTGVFSNKNLVDNTVYFVDATDNTIRCGFDCAGVTGSTTILRAVQNASRTLTLPDLTDNLVSRNSVDTLANKTLTLPAIAQIVNTGTLTLPTSSDTLVGRATVDTLTNKTLTTPQISQIINGGTIDLPVGTHTLISRTSTDTVTNKSLVDTSTFIVDSVDNTSKIGWNVAGSTGTTMTITSVQTANRVITLPDATTTLVGTDTSQTLSNKTLISPQISSISNGGTVTIPSGVETLVGRATADTLSNKSLVDFTTYIIDIGDNTVRLGWNIAGTTGTTTTINTSQTANRVITLPDATTTLVGTDTSQTLSGKTLITPQITSIINGGTIGITSGTYTLLGDTTTNTITNKSLVDSSTAIVDSGDNSKKLLFDITGSVGTTTTIITAQTANRGITLPDATTTLVGNNTTDVLSNKTLITPIISSISNGGTVTIPTGTYTLIGDNSANTLTNKTLVDSSTAIVDFGDNTKKLLFDISGGASTNTTIATAQTANRVVTLPDATTTLVGTNTAQTLTNKTLILPEIASIKNSSSTLLLPVANTTLVGLSTTDILTNKIITDSSNNVAASALRSTGSNIVVSSAAPPVIGYVLTATSASTANWQVAPGAGGGTFSDDSFYIYGSGDASKRLYFEVDGVTTTTKTTVHTTQIGTDIDIYLPNITSTLISSASVDTLTNKTITSSTNNVYANGLNTSGAAVVVSGSAPPTLGQGLIATSATTATWQNVSSVITEDTIFGSGGDGNATIAVNTSITEDMYYDNLTVNPGIRLISAGYMIYVSTLLTLDGTISCNGANGTSSTFGGTGGAGAPSGTVGGGTDGANGVVNLPGRDGGGIIYAAGGAGGNGGDTTTPPARSGGLGGTVDEPPSEVGGIKNITMNRNPYTKLRSNNSVLITGGSGGGSGAVGNVSAGSGGGGGGAGVVFIAAKNITGSGVIEARGGAAGAISGTGNIAGSGGGGGGLIFVISMTDMGLSSVTLNVSGGAGSAPQLSATAGTAGASGRAVTIKV